MIQVQEESIDKSNKDEALEYLMKRYGNKILKLAYYYVRDRFQAEDIAQDVFCKVYENLDKFREESSYYTWIYKITLNKCRDYMRSYNFKKILYYSCLNMNFINKQKLSNKLFEEVEGGEIFSKVMELPLKYRIIIVLYYFEGLSTVEISNILDLKESTVRTRLTRGREKLKKLLSEEAPI